MDIKNTINTQTDTYLVIFENSMSNRFIVKYDHLAEPLKQLDNGLYLGDIYRFNNTKLKFERVPKSKYKTLFSWDTESMELLRKHKIIK